MSDHVEALLRELGAELRTPEPGPGLPDAVVARVAATPPRPLRRIRWVAALVIALLLAGLAVSPVGAKVVEWLDFHGVMVRDQDSELSGTPAVPSESAAPTEVLEQASFDPLMPSALGRPDGVSVSGDGRLVSMSWSDGDRTIRLDQFEGELDPMFWKSSPDAQIVEVAGRDGLWFPSPHDVVVVPDGGTPETHAPRLAAQTLVVPRDGVTVRLEGSFGRTRAVQIASTLE